VQSKFMLEAIRLAIKNVHKAGGPFAALVVKSGKILATGVNQVTTTNDPSAHAEIVAIRNACRILKSFQLAGCEIYTTCEPCLMCVGAIYWARPLRVYFGSTRKDAARAGFDDSFIYQQLKLPQSRRNIPCTSFLRAESLQAFEAWEQHEGKVTY
jgi:guanine deaminase